MKYHRPKPHHKCRRPTDESHQPTEANEAVTAPSVATLRNVGAPEAQRAAAIAGMQRAAGNAAVERILSKFPQSPFPVLRCGCDSRKGCACGSSQTQQEASEDDLLGSEQTLRARRLPVAEQAIQRDARQVPVGPVIISTDRRTQTRKQVIADRAMEHLPEVGQRFLNEWLQASEDGVQTAAAPEDPIAKENWYLALAGNMLWASTSLMAPELAAPLSFLGAAMGSGVAAAEEAPAGEGIRLITERLQRSRIAMEGTLRPKIVDVAIECATEDISDIEEQKLRLWKKLFPEVPYENRFPAITQDTRQKLARALPQFIRQWHVWKEEVRHCALEKQQSDPFGLRGPDISAKHDLTSGNRVAEVQRFWPLWVRAPTEAQLRACRREHPFQPNLDF